MRIRLTGKDTASRVAYHTPGSVEQTELTKHDTASGVAYQVDTLADRRDHFAQDLTAQFRAKDTASRVAYRTE